LGEIHLNRLEDKRTADGPTVETLRHKIETKGISLQQRSSHYLAAPSLELGEYGLFARRIDATHAAADDDDIEVELPRVDSLVVGQSDELGSSEKRRVWRDGGRDDRETVARQNRNTAHRRSHAIICRQPGDGNLPDALLEQNPRELGELHVMVHRERGVAVHKWMAAL
jgi:hypothetical protein